MIHCLGAWLAARSRHSTVGNARWNGTLGCCRKGSFENFCVESSAQFSAVASDVSERITSVFPRDPAAKNGRRASPEFTTTERGRWPLEWFLRWPIVVLLMIGVNCSLFASKPAHISRFSEYFSFFVTIQNGQEKAGRTG